ncbi:premnaspirodiene oxygenase-like [Camellia sinensis]|uniref:premnaspirodiene oxygenase-like n=1 Tax=Camellia sinensis TaxID=4442 RepID=UPI0010362B22|nr:premnaspirodiene oxygenase-like [Camellia sinensis]
MAKEVLKKHDLAFTNRPNLLVGTIMTYDKLDIVFSSYGDYWRQMRKICILELLSAKNVRSFCSIRENGVLHLIKSIKMSSRSLINLTEKVFTLMNAITSRTTFGRRFKQEDELIHLVKESVSLGSDFNVSNLFSSLKFLHVLSGMKLKLGNGESREEDIVDMLLRLMEMGDLEFHIATNNIKVVILQAENAAALEEKDRGSGREHNLEDPVRPQLRKSEMRGNEMKSKDSQ